MRRPTRQSAWWRTRALTLYIFERCHCEWRWWDAIWTLEWTRGITLIWGRRWRTTKKRIERDRISMKRRGRRASDDVCVCDCVRSQNPIVRTARERDEEQHAILTLGERIVENIRSIVRWRQQEPNSHERAFTETETLSRSFEELIQLLPVKIYLGKERLSISWEERSNPNRCHAQISDVHLNHRTAGTSTSSWSIAWIVNVHVLEHH